MNNKEFASKALDIAKNYKTVYANGMFGSLITEQIIAQKAKQLPGWYATSRQAALRSLIGKNYFGFDCVCFVKAILWGWSGSTDKNYGGAVYHSNGVPDIGEGEMLNACSDVSEDFKNIAVGEYLWTSGHCGIYIGDGLAVECTPKWKNGVQITAVDNIAQKAGYNSRMWKKHGKLPYVTYVDVRPEPAPAGKTVTVELLTLRRGENRLHPQIYTIQRLLKLMGYYTMDIDGSFGGGTDTAVRTLQKDKGLEVDGVVGLNTWNALLK